MTEKPELLRTRPVCGKVTWIGIAAQRRKPLEPQQSVTVQQDKGIDGEHHAGNTERPHRQVTLIQKEHFPVIADLLSRNDVTPEQLRRNIVVSGINVASLRSQEFLIGDAVLQGTGDCVPCALMDATLGKGGYAAMVGHGGITAAVVKSGTISVGDPVSLLDSQNSVERIDEEAANSSS